MGNVYDTLQARGFVEQVSDEAGLRAKLEQPTTCYVGYDPTASSLHVGNLFTIMALAHMQRHGHRPIAIVGGGTGMIGDPSGKTEMRQLLTAERIEENLQAIKGQIGRLVDFSEGKALIINNADWLLGLNYVTFLREIGRHFSVNRMLAAESYKMRMQTGLSFIEFNYQLLQAYDFLHLYQEFGCALQMGGNDQWGNILAGVDLIRRIEGAETYALTFPLLTTSSGAKMGKTAKGAVWLDGERMSPYDFYQFWINTADSDVERFLKIYTFLPLEQIGEYAKLEGAASREAKRVLAREVTTLIHGREAADKAQEASKALFGAGPSGASVPTTTLSAEVIGEGLDVAALFQKAGLCRSRSEARRLVQQGGAYVNGEKVSDLNAVYAAASMTGEGLTLRAGKKRYHRIVSE